MGIIKDRCVIIGGGDCTTDIIKKNINIDSDFIICADSGYDYAISAKLTPHLLIGDFDSIKAIPNIEEKITLPVEKDVTDTLAAFNEGVKRGFTSFLLLGGTGGRFEHTFANISLMAKASTNNINFSIIDKKHTFRAITNSSIKIKRRDDQQISVFAYGGDSEGVTEKGFHYSLNDFKLSAFDGALGTSNDIIDEYGEISVKNGTLIIIETNM